LPVTNYQLPSIPILAGKDKMGRELQPVIRGMTSAKSWQKA
jgi:hypothetical protein